MKTQIAVEGVQRVWFYALALAVPSYWWTGIGNTTQNDAGGTPRTWIGVGDGGSMTGLKNDDPLRAGSISISLAGVPSASVPAGVIAATRAVKYQGKVLDIYMSVVNPLTGVPLLTPEVIWSGFADVMSMQVGSTVVASLTAEHRTSVLRRTAGLYMTTESHNARLGNPTPRDLFYEPQSDLMGMPRPFLDPNG